LATQYLNTIEMDIVDKISKLKKKKKKKKKEEEEEE
jgi:hypothetical protein